MIDVYLTANIHHNSVEYLQLVSYQVYSVVVQVCYLRCNSGPQLQILVEVGVIILCSNFTTQKSARALN